MAQKESILSLMDAIPCREIQIRQLATLFCQSFASPPTTVVFGVESTGKSLTVSSVLESCNTRHALVHSVEWMNSFELLEAIISGIANISKDDEMKKNLDTFKIQGRIGWENLPLFYNQIKLLLKGKGHTILVVDGIEKERDNWQTLLPAMSRLGEIVENLSIILVVTTARTLELHNGIPYVYFPPYTRPESIYIASSSHLPLGDIDVPGSEAEWLRTSFCGLVWDSIGQAVARDIVAFRNVCERLWKPFVKPIVQGQYAPRDLDKLLIKSRSLFQGDRMMEPEIVPWVIGNSPSTSNVEHYRSTLPCLKIYLLIAAYLASHTLPRLDYLRFSKFHQYKEKRKALSRGSKSSRSHRRMPCHLKAPKNFPAERLYAIFHTIVPSYLCWSDAEAELDESLTDLCGMRLLSRSVRADYFRNCKWRVGIDLKFVTDLANEVGFDFDEYLWD